MMVVRLVTTLCLLLSVTQTFAADGGTSKAQGAGLPVPDINQPPQVKIAKGPPPSAKMVCAPNPVMIGEPLVCTLTVIHRKDVSITVTSPDDVVALKADAAQPHGANLLKSIRQLQIIPKSMKKAHVKDLTVTWTESDSSVGELPIPAQRIPVRSMMTGAQDPAPRQYGNPQGSEVEFWDRHGPVPYRVTNWPLIIILMVLIGGGLGVALGIWINRWLRARQAEDGPWVDPRPAHVIALVALHSLIEEQLPSQALYEEYYVRISEIVRGYLKRRYGINGLEMTSQEIRDWAQEVHLEHDAQNAITDFLYETDIVKFANVTPSPDEIDTITRQARGLIELTKVVVSEPEETENEVSVSAGPLEEGGAQ